MRRVKFLDNEMYKGDERGKDGKILEMVINEWLENNNVDIISISYGYGTYYASALVLYETKE